MRDHAPDQTTFYRPDELREQYHGAETAPDDGDPLAVFRGILNAFTLFALTVVVVAFLWLMLSQAFASGVSTECDARGYAGAECMAFHQEAR